MKEEKFPNTRKPSHQGGLWEVLESQRATQPGKHTHTHTHNTCLTATPSGQVAQTLGATAREGGQTGREVQVACLG